MSYENKMADAVVAIENHNQSFGENSENKINISKFKKRLQEIGGVDDASLSMASFEDLEECGLPRILAKGIAKVFRKKDDGKKKIVTPNKAMAMSSGQLLDNYDVNEPKDAVAVELHRRSEGKSFIVFNVDGTVNRGVSLKLLDEIRQGFPSRDNYVIDGRPAAVYVVGEGHNRYADENPLYEGEMLRPDGTCLQTNVNWSLVPFVIRQLIHVAVHKTGEIKIGDVDDTIGLVERASEQTYNSQMRSRYPKASILLDQLKERGDDPSLRLEIRQSKQKKNDPFFAHKTY